MDQRHFSNSFGLAGDHGQDRNRLTAQQSYSHTGRAGAPQNGLSLHPVENGLRGGYHRTQHLNPENIAYPSALSSSTHISHLQPAFAGPSYDPYPQSFDAGNLYLPSQNNSTFSHPNHYNRYNVIQDAPSPQDSRTRSSGMLKRKGPETSMTYERGSSSSKYYGAGSSSSYFEMPLRKSSTNVYYGHREAPHCGNNSFSMGENSSRNVRSRYGRDLEDNQSGTHFFRHSSHHHHPPHPPGYHGASNLANINGVGTSQQFNFDPLHSVTHGSVQIPGASGLSRGNNQLVMRGNGSKIRVPLLDSGSGRNVASSSQYVPHAPLQGARGRSSSHLVRAIPPCNAGVNTFTRHSSWTEDDLPTYTPPSFRHPSHYAEEWHNSYNDGTSGLSIERFHSVASLVNANGRIGSEDVTMDLSTFYANSRNSFDQFRDMRLDIDDMSYEELLDLGERIGNVNTGLSDDVILKSLTEEICSSMQKNEEETCVICLEEYGKGANIGTMMNCGHKYHATCIKSWLSMKNVCPICKVPALKDRSEEE